MTFKRTYTLCITTMCAIFVLSCVILSTWTSGIKVNLVYSAYKLSGICLPRKLSYIKDTGTKRKFIALASYPGSGNTWLRHLIQELTGYHTGSVYDDDDIALNGFEGERANINDLNKQCIVYKTHKLNAEMDQNFTKALILIRNPVNAVQSLFNYQFSRRKKVQTEMKNLAKIGVQRRHLGVVQPFLFNSSRYGIFLKNRVSQWQRRNVAWLEKFQGRCLVVLYENLKTNLSMELMRIAKFLGVSIQSEDIICTVKNKEGHFHRDSKQADFNVFSVLNDENKNVINSAVYDTSNVTERLNMSLDLSRYLL